MDKPILTQRLQLIPLNIGQLQLVLEDLDSFEKSLDIPLMRSFITDRVRRAIAMKIDKMKKADVSQHGWFTYWLIVVRDENTGAGMLGFKGFPNENGSTEIGYGIDPSHQGKGYMSEAVRALIDWAFTHPLCKVITATEVENPASKRLIENLGGQWVSSTDDSTSWEFRKPE